MMHSRMMRAAAYAILSAVAVAAAMIGGAPTANAAAPADYPERPITLVVPYEAGGGNDVIARLVAAKMSAALGQPIVIENRGGAGSTIGTRDVARAQARRLHDIDRHQCARHQSVALSRCRLRSEKGFCPDRADRDQRKSGPGTAILPAHSMAELIALAKQHRANSILLRPGPAPARILPPNCSPPWRA